MALVSYEPNYAMFYMCYATIVMIVKLYKVLPHISHVCTHSIC